MIYWNYGNSSFFNTVKGSETVEKTYQFLDIEINKPIYRKLSAVQYDNNSRYILVSAYSSFQPYDLTYATVKIYGIKKDKTVFFNNAKILDAVNGKFEIDLTEQCLACDGDVEIQILILGLDKARLSSNSFIVNVKKNIIDPVRVTSQEEWGMLTDGLASLAEYDIYKSNVDRHDKEIKGNKNQINILSNTVVSNLYNTEGIISQIMNTAKSYTDNFDKIVYGNKYTAYDKEVKPVNGKYELDCSSFINLLIHGVKFHNSRYNGKNDNYGSPLFFHGIDSYKYRLANQMAQFCVENGYVFKPAKDLSNIRAGDLMFFSWTDFETNPDKYTQAQIDFHNNAFMKIDHVAMYLDQKNDTIYQTIQYEQYTPHFLYDVDLEYMQQCILVARLPFANVENYENKNLIVNGNKKQICQNSIKVGSYYLNKKLVKGSMYSLTVNGKVDTNDCYFIVQANGKTIHSDYGRATTNGTVLFYFVYKEDIEVDEITISIGSSDTTNTLRNGHVNWCCLNEGYRLVSNVPQNTGMYNFRELPLTDWIKNKIVDGFAASNTLLETETHYLINLNLPVDEDFVTNEILIGNSHANISNTMRLPCNLISHDNTSVNGILQFKWNGEISIIKFNSQATWRHAMASGIILK